MSKELKPCPFCGGDASFDHDDIGWNWIHCKSCDVTTNARVSAMDDCRPLLAEAWNRRAPAEPVSVPSDAEILEVMKPCELLTSITRRFYEDEWTEQVICKSTLLEKSRMLIAKYAAPQPQHIPPERPYPDTYLATWHEAKGWNACRAAMLEAWNTRAEPVNHSVQDCPEDDKWNCKYCKRVNSCPVQGHRDAHPTKPVKVPSDPELLEILKTNGFEFHYDRYVKGSGYGLLSRPYRLEDFRALLEKYGHNNQDAARYRTLRAMPPGMKILAQVAPGEWEEILSGDELDGFLMEYPR